MKIVEVDNDLFLDHADRHTCSHSLVAFLWVFCLAFVTTGQQVKRFTVPALSIFGFTYHSSLARICVAVLAISLLL